MSEESKVSCWQCGRSLDLPNAKISFQAVCDHCSAWLHCCKNCTYYKPGRHNDCLIPGTEQISDREGKNFCDEFLVLGKKEAPSEAIDAARKLFGDDAAQELRDQNDQSRFDNLFGNLI